MSSLALRKDAWQTRRMAGSEDSMHAERKRAGAALRTLRNNARLTQEAAAAGAGIGVQTWQNYEVGRRGIPRATLPHILQALDATEEGFQLEIAKLADLERTSASYAMEDRSRPFTLPLGGVAYGGTARPAVYDMSEPEVIDFAAYFTPGSRVLRLAGMSMYPYADEGGFVTYNLRRPPRRGQGCVIERKDGSYLVKRFDRFSDEKLHVTELYPTERALTFDLSEIHGVYAIGLRGD